MAALAITQGVMQHQQASAVAKYSNKVADANIAASHKGFEDSARAMNARQVQEQEAIADKRRQQLIAYMENMGTAQAANAERGVTGRVLEMDLAQRQADYLNNETGVNRALDSVATAFAFERNGLESTLQGRIMQANAQRKPKPDLLTSLVTTGVSAGMSYASANSGTGADGTGQTFSQNWDTFKGNFTS
jgi:hypothetical protein